ncbi:MAG: penicillin-binding protein 2 [Peptococcaceae bacterium]|jgi:penicillin-binding protein 2|nr:penicillin-binding protein 2 [Peptococcaceae bacterium]
MSTGASPLWEESRERKQTGRRLILFGVATALIFAALVSRLFWLQVMREEIFLDKAATQSTRWIREPAARGEILDSQGEVLVTNRPVYNLTLNYLGLKGQDISLVADRLAELLADPEITAATVLDSVNAQSSRLYEPIMIKRNIPFETVIRLEERRWELPGVMVETSPQRDYVYGGMLGHLLGYVHSIKEEIDQPGFEDYGLGDLTGKTGVEKSYEFELRGTDGYREVTVNAKNHPLQELSYLPSVSGNTLRLTVDLGLQRALEDAFDEVLASVAATYPKAQAGAAVVLDVNTGGVLGMVSRPMMFPADFNGNPLSQEQADLYFNQEPAALYNRAIQGSYVPGSTFKPITGMAALASGNLTPQDRITCGGAYWYKPYIKCTGVHGSLNYLQAMARSCNVYFQEAARRAGIENIGRIGHEFGMDSKTGLDLPFEGAGLLPSVDWQVTEYARREIRINEDFDGQIAGVEGEYQPLIDGAADEAEKKRLERELRNRISVLEAGRQEQLNSYTSWRDADTFNTGIGQGYNQYTIVELAAYAATIANGGTYYTPYVVDEIFYPDGTLKEAHAPEGRRVDVEQWILDLTKEAMTMVARPGGTAYAAFAGLPPGTGGGAKTGTAQTGRAGYSKEGDYDGLFIAFAPAENPQIAFACVMEHGHSGSGSAGRVAKLLLEYYFQEME